MARVLIVGCGCRGRALGGRLAAEGWAVRGTSRDEAGLEKIEAAAIEPALADPQRPATLLGLIDDVSVVVWLLGSAAGEDESLAALHGERLESLLEKLVDTPVRGFVYEAVGSVPASALETGNRAVSRARSSWRIRTAILTATAIDHDRWLDAAACAVQDALVGVGAGGSI